MTKHRWHNVFFFVLGGLFFAPVLNLVRGIASRA